MKTILDALGHRHGTDKASGPHQHDYLHWYERFLHPLRDKKLIIMEMGIGSGGSLKMWRDYFIRAKIVGFDTGDKKEYNGERIETMIGDQNSEQDINQLIERYGPFDVVVDDAGHDPNCQVKCFQMILPHVNPGGYYILEDIGGGQCTDMLRDLAVKVIQGQSDRVESIAFYKDTSISRIKDG